MLSESATIFCLISNYWKVIYVAGASKIAYNVLALGEEADFEAQNCLTVLNLIRSTKLHLSNEPAFLPNACYVLPFFLSYCFIR